MFLDSNSTDKLDLNIMVDEVKNQAIIIEENNIPRGKKLSKFINFSLNCMLWSYW